MVKKGVPAWLVQATSGSLEVFSGIKSGYIIFLDASIKIYASDIREALPETI